MKVYELRYGPKYKYGLVHSRLTITRTIAMIYAEEEKKAIPVFENSELIGYVEYLEGYREFVWESLPKDWKARNGAGRKFYRLYRNGKLGPEWGKERKKSKR